MNSMHIHDLAAWSSALTHTTKLQYVRILQLYTCGSGHKSRAKKQIAAKKQTE